MVVEAQAALPMARSSGDYAGVNEPGTSRRCAGETGALALIPVAALP